MYITMTNKSVNTFIYVNKICVCMLYHPSLTAGGVRIAWNDLTWSITASIHTILCELNSMLILTRSSSIQDNKFYKIRLRN